MALLPVNLTVELSGRTEVPRARQSVFAQQTHKAPSLTTVHGPLQRLLEVTSPTTTVPVRPSDRNQTQHSLRGKRAQASIEEGVGFNRLPRHPSVLGARPVLNRIW